MASLRVVALSIIVCSAISCTTMTPQLTQLQIRELQTREFDADSRTVFKACLNALQDDGYIVENAMSDVGLLSASKEVQRSRGQAVAWTALLVGIAIATEGEVTVGYPGNPEMQVNVGVTDFGDRSHVRATFVVKVMGIGGGPVTDQKVYQDFFAKVDKAVFLEKQKV